MGPWQKNLLLKPEPLLLFFILHEIYFYEYSVYAAKLHSGAYFSQVYSAGVMLYEIQNNELIFNTHRVVNYYDQ